MFCLLCHEKVPRLRAWRTKSEFCCDEHAEIYKRQTLERLLTDQKDEEAADSLPLPVETGSAAPASESESAPASPAAAETLARFEEFDKPAAGLDAREEPKPLEDDSSDEGIRELWRLAEEVGPSKTSAEDDWASDAPGLPGETGGLRPNAPGTLGGGSGSPREQSPEEALAALRELSSRRPGGAALEDTGSNLDSLLSGREATEEPRAGGLGALDELDERPELDDLDKAEDLPALGEALPDEDSLPPLDMGALEPLDDDELPSILDRLTEGDSAETELETSEAAQGAEDLEAVAEAEETAAEEITEEASSGQEQPAAAASSDEAVEESVESVEAKSIEEESVAFDLLEEAVESHLEEREDKPAEGGSRKVVPFPLSREKTPGQADKKREESQPAAASSSSAPAAKSGSRQKGAKGKSGADLSRMRLKPVAVMFGIEPSLCEPASDGEQTPTGLTASAEQNGMAEPPMYYPDAARAADPEASLPVHAHLYRVLPGLLEASSLLNDPESPDSPDYTLPFMAPLPLATERSAKPGKRSLGSERAWMVRIEPELIEAAEFEIALPNGDQHSPWLSPQLPAGLLAGMALGNGSGKLDLSGSGGSYEPPVDRLCLVLPELGELGGSPKQSSSKTQGEGLAGWMPPTVLDPRFDVERPGGRDVSDFG